MKIKVSAARRKERRLFSQATPRCISPLSLTTDKLTWRAMRGSLIGRN